MITMIDLSSSGKSVKERMDRTESHVVMNHECRPELFGHGGPGLSVQCSGTEISALKAGSICNPEKFFIVK